jgi:hypothetical protein
MTGDVAESVCEISRQPQVLRGGTIGRIVDGVSLAALTRRAREEQIGAPCVDVDCTLCDQFRRLRNPEIVTDQNIPC